MPLNNDRQRLLALSLAITPRYINRNNPSQVIRYHNFSVVVPIHNPNSHDYPMGEPFIILPQSLNEDNNYGSGFLKIDGTRGNFINANATRHATPAEIERFVTNLPDHGMTFVSPHLVEMAEETEE